MRGFRCLLVLLFVTSAMCNSTTRQSRLLSFKTDEEGDVSVELAFNVPFLKIPVKRSVDSVKGAVANVNVGAIALSGGLILATVGLFPAISWLMSKKKHGIHHPYRSATDGDDFPSTYDQVTKLFEDFLAQNNVEPLTCLQKVLCWSVKKSSRKVRNGRGESVDKIIDGLASSEWINFVVEGTPLKEALDSGIRGSNCATEYTGCKISKSDLEVFANELFGDKE